MDESVSGPTDTPEESPRDDSHSQTQSQSGGTKAPAVKDKNCPYCRQAFTSSSLGRHLDQYLLKKKPDGIHDVDEIRRIRGGITRRQARTSSGRRESLEPSASASVSKASAEPRAAVVVNSGKPAGEGYVRMMFNTPTWHTTGVINDIPSPSTPQDAYGLQRITPPQPANTIVVSDPTRQTDTTNPDTARALELALREVLDNVKAATNRAQPRLSPFDFDLQSQTFPQLCLQVLPPPPSLFSAQPFASPTSFPLEPPGLGQLDIVRQNLCAQIEQWKADQLAAPEPSTRLSGGSMPYTHNTFTNSPDSDMISSTARQHQDMAVRHLDLALKHWMALPRPVQQETWQLEITRAFAREVEKRKKTDAQLVRVQQEANQLRAQVDKLASCQWPREFAIFPPDTLPIPRDVAGELDTDAKSTASRWDFDNVVAKWKRVVMHDKGMGPSGTNFSHNAAVVEETRKNNSNKRGSASNSSNTNRPGSSRVSAIHAPSSIPNSPLEGPRQIQQTPHDSKRNSTLGPTPKRQRLNGRGKNTDNENAVNGSIEHASNSRSVSSPALALMPPPHSGAPPHNPTPTFRHYKPRNGETKQDTEPMDLDPDDDDPETDGDGDDEDHNHDDADADADGEADADGDEEGDQNENNRPHLPHRQNQQNSGGSGAGNFDGPRVLMDMRARGVQS
ncbi:hypothetical protein FQN54_001643 [Arachnomyces sp. PD_36]|nr:hypothetical protein FQN54_001643 [Arachnomyces sp. PD_36]